MTQVLLLFGLIICVVAGYIFKLRIELTQLRFELAELNHASPPAINQPVDTALNISAETLPGAGLALKSPPSSFDATLRALRTKTDQLYRFALGWCIKEGNPFLLTASFVGDVNHMLITGQSDSGKDNAAINIMLSLALTHSPKQVQFCVLDGKSGLDWQNWQGKAHIWHIATTTDLTATMQRLSEERERRTQILLTARVKKWDSYQGNDLPLLIVYVSELSLLASAMGKNQLNAWLNTELTSARAVGIRYVIATQTATNLDTTWRGQISLYLAGKQALDSQDRVVTGMSATEVESLGAVAPSKLPAPSNGAQGVFLALQDTNAVNVRTSYISDTHEKYLLQQLPEQPKAAQKSLQSQVQNDVFLDQLLTSDDNDFQIELVNFWNDSPSEPVGRSTIENRALEIGRSTVLQTSSTNRTDENLRSDDKIPQFYKELPFTDDKIPIIEQQRIIENAPTVNSKRQLCLKLYGTDGGQKSTWVKLVCDAMGFYQSSSVGVGK